jgi:hypothetical protein
LPQLPHDAASAAAHGYPGLFIIDDENLNLDSDRKTTQKRPCGSEAFSDEAIQLLMQNVAPYAKLNEISLASGECPN